MSVTYSVVNSALSLKTPGGSSFIWLLSKALRKDIPWLELKFYYLLCVATVEYFFDRNRVSLCPVRLNKRFYCNFERDWTNWYMSLRHISKIKVLCEQTREYTLRKVQSQSSRTEHKKQRFQRFVAWFCYIFPILSSLTRELRACARASCRYDVGNGTRSLARSIGRFL